MFFEVFLPIKLTVETNCVNINNKTKGNDNMKKSEMKENIYESLRKERGLTREKVCDIVAEQGLGVLTNERLFRIEKEIFQIHPEEVLLLSKVYNEPVLCNHYCVNECPLGIGRIPEVKMKDLEKIVLSMLASLNSIQMRKERLVEISADGEIDENEMLDFINIKKELEEISVSVETLKLWAEQKLASKKAEIENKKK